MADEQVTQQILDYLRQHASQYTPEALRQQVYNQGFDKALVDAAFVYFEAEQTSQTVNAIQMPVDRSARWSGVFFFAVLHAIIAALALSRWIVAEVVVGPSLGPTIPLTLIAVLGLECAAGLLLWWAGRERFGKTLVYGVLSTIVLTPLVMGTCIVVLSSI